MAQWYVDVLGLTLRNRRAYGFPGTWLYAGQDPVIHLISSSGSPGVGSEHSLRLEHYAFIATNRKAFEERLNEMGQDYKLSTPQALSSVMLDMHDPDGNHIHVDFKLHEVQTTDLEPAKSRYEFTESLLTGGWTSLTRS